MGVRWIGLKSSMEGVLEQGVETRQPFRLKALPLVPTPWQTQAKQLDNILLRKAEIILKRCFRDSVGFGRIWTEFNKLGGPGPPTCCPISGRV